jgi:hypothetical protein
MYYCLKITFLSQFQLKSSGKTGKGNCAAVQIGGTAALIQAV